MAWLGRQSTSGRRHSVGGAQPNSLRDALRARGGAQNIPRATTDVEDNEDIPVKGNLDWLGLNPFAPKAMGSLVDRLKATGEGAMDRIKAGIGEDAVDRLKAGGAGAFDRIKAGAGAVLAGEFSAEDHPLSFSPPKRQAEHESASSSEANGRKSISGRKSTSLRSALQARGGIGRSSVGSSEAPETSDPVQEQDAPKVDEVADDQQEADNQFGQHDDQPSLEKALSSPLPAVREDDEEEESPQHDVAETLRQEVENEAEVAVNESEIKAGSPSENLAEEPDERVDAEAEADTETAEASRESEAFREAAVLGEDASSAVVGGLETALHDRSLADESVHVVAPEPTKTKSSPAQSSGHSSKSHLDSASRLPVPPSYVSKNLDEHAVVVQRQAPSAEPEKPAGPPLLAPAPPQIRRPDREDQDVGKLKELREFWGSKKSKGFAGPELGTSRLSKNEAQASLQRLISAGGDFDEVRRLRKLIQELDQ